MASGKAEVLSRLSTSPLAEIYKTEAFRTDWANDVRFHVARHLLHLRRYRGMSQGEVSKAMGTSQSAVARIESAQENITVDTLQRLIVALNGRFHVSIQPQEYPEPQKRPWWEVAPRVESEWTVVRIEGLRNSQTDQFTVGLERPHGLYTTSPIALSKAGMLHEGKTKG